MRGLAVVLAGGSLASCATTDGHCNAQPVQHLVGQTADRTMEQDIMRLTGSHSVRWLTSEHIVTTAKIQSRLTIETYDIGAGERISRIHCF